LNRNDGLCDQVGTTNYDQWLDSTGRPMQWNSREMYLQGETITIKSRLTALPLITVVTVVTWN
jgi:hypothetical protein